MVRCMSPPNLTLRLSEHDIAVFPGSSVAPDRFLSVALTKPDLPKLSEQPISNSLPQTPPFSHKADLNSLPRIMPITAPVVAESELPPELARARLSGVVLKSDGQKPNLPPIASSSPKSKAKKAVHPEPAPVYCNFPTKIKKRGSKQQLPLLPLTFPQATQPAKLQLKGGHISPVTPIESEAGPAAMRGSVPELVPSNRASVATTTYSSPPHSPLISPTSTEPYPQSFPNTYFPVQPQAAVQYPPYQFAQPYMVPSMPVPMHQIQIPAVQNQPIQPIQAPLQPLQPLQVQQVPSCVPQYLVPTMAPQPVPMTMPIQAPQPVQVSPSLAQPQSQRQSQPQLHLQTQLPAQPQAPAPQLTPQATEPQSQPLSKSQPQSQTQSQTQTFSTAPVQYSPPSDACKSDKPQPQFKVTSPYSILPEKVPGSNPSGRVGKQPVRDPEKLKHRIWLQQNRMHQDRLHQLGFRILEGVNGSKICSLCQMEFSKEMFVWRHAWQHVNEKPFHCHVCRQKFTRSDTLQRHVRRTGHHLSPGA